MILTGNSLEVLKELPENSIDSVVTDPPYGLSFMGKKWDYDVPSVELWREVLRVLKPGGHLLSFGGTRTYHRLVVNIEDAGFEIRDQIMWLYGSGFPKSMNLKGEHQGWGTALKPANEPICVARKPLEKSLTVAENVLKWGTGALNIDASRISGQKRSPEFKNPKSELGYHGGSANSNLVGWDASQGRWPANLLLDETAAEMLDEQSGVSKEPLRVEQVDKSIWGTSNKSFKGVRGHGDSGGASRFFYVAKASKRERNAGLEEMPEKTTDDGREKSIDNPYLRGETKRQNSHPTVKPIKLMEYLCRLVTPPNGVILDPFTGSGSTGVAAIQLGYQFIGIELDPAYAEIAEKRIASVSFKSEPA